MFKKRVEHVHFVGIGGIGMSGIAEVLVNLGYAVSGSDAKDSDTTRRLRQLGARVEIGHRHENLDRADVVVYSSAIKRDNPELLLARERGIPVIGRAEMLGELMRVKEGVAIAGSHGKTTTTSLIATVLGAAGLDPTVVIGGRLNALGSNARLGTGEILVAEADESDGSFVKLAPTWCVVTNVDPEHLDHFGTHAAIKTAFVDFINRIPFFGLAVVCLDHEHVRDILPRIEKRYTTYGLSAQADYRAHSLSFQGIESRFRLLRRGEDLGEFTVRMPGAHNVLNCLAALAICDELQVPLDVAREAIASFGGVHRRFTILGEPGGVLVVDDYGHHPAEIRATLGAAKSGFGRRVVMAFQPHRHTRTRDCFEEFVRCFDQADELFVLDIYPAGEEPIAGISAKTLVDAIRARGHRAVHHVADRRTLAARVVAALRPGDLVITQGAGDITRSSAEILERLGAGHG